jgi:hypothetical protein
MGQLITTNGEKIKYSGNSAQATLWQFKKVVETDDLRYLLELKDYDELPEVDTTALTVAWHTIYEDFSESAGGNRSELWLTKQKTIIDLKFRHDIDAAIIRVVAKHPVEGMIDLAEEMGYPMDKENIQGSIDKAVSRVKKMKKQIQREEKEQPEEERPDFDALVTSLERFQGYQFDEKAMTVRKFANIYKAQKDAAEDRTR